MNTWLRSTPNLNASLPVDQSTATKKRQNRNKSVDQFASNHPELQKSLDLRKLVLTVQNSLDSKKGTCINWSQKMIVSGLQQNAFKLKQPISLLLDPYVFDLEVLFSVFEKVVKGLAEWKIKERDLLSFLAKVKNRKRTLRGYVKAALKNDVSYFKRHGKKARLEEDLLFFIADTMVQPCLSEIARQMDKSFLETWGGLNPSVLYVAGCKLLPSMFLGNVT